jgi:cytochrome b561
MVSKDASISYTGTAKFLHWLVVALLIIQFALAWTMPMSLTAQVGTLISLHFSFGVLIFLVAIVRLSWRTSHGEPPPPEGMPLWQVFSARLVHWLLYLLIFALPIFGWLNASWRGMPVSLFGLFEVPALIAKHAPGWRWTGSVHVYGAEYALIGLVGLHVAAALYHSVIRRDGVLQRMLPGR